MWVKFEWALQCANRQLKSQTVGQTAGTGKEEDKEGQRQDAGDKAVDDGSVLRHGFTHLQCLRDKKQDAKRSAVYPYTYTCLT